MKQKKFHHKSRSHWLLLLFILWNYWSGGIKLFPEQIETKLASKIINRFFVAGLPDDVLGTKVVLVIEGNEYKVETSLFNDLEKFEKPRDVIFIPQFIETGTNKINRIQTLNTLKVN